MKRAREEVAVTVMSRQRPPEGAPVRDGPVARFAKPAGRFTIHVLGMCLVMCLSLALFSMTVAGASSAFGVPDIEQRFPELSALLVAAVFAIAMVVWMRLMRMAWRPTVEMSGAAIVAGLLMITGNRVGLVAAGDLVGGVCGLACATMVVIMLVRFRLYAGVAGHSAHSRRHAHSA